MFDIGFTELMVIGVVALIVIGPERLPKAARTAGHLFGRLQRYVSDVKADISREMELEELKKLRQEVQSAAQDMQTSMTSAVNEVESQVRSVRDDFASLSQSVTGEEGTPGSAPSASPPAAASSSGADPAVPSLAQLPPLAEPPVPVDPPRQSALPGFDKI